MADDDFDRPHHHISGHDNDDPRVYLDDTCDNDNDTCPVDSPVVVVALDDYRKLVAAARDRHPTNHQPGRAVLGSPNTARDDVCPSCGYPINWSSPSPT